ncbi:uncharacterized protein LOC123470647 [Daphnia magna]|uniref:uncharacterized protein LOC123470647 n=1 Tax=Daphnia magna TaxID=35525 RepID=UPI001E1BBE8E|nr:uncharacterized protein LOC123470647 [Daphnia magna]
MGGIDLLLGKDFLERFGTRMKIGALPEFIIGDIPMGMMAEKEIETPELVSRVGRMIPARSSVVVEIELTAGIPGKNGAMIEPSTSVLEWKGVSTGRLLVADCETFNQVLVTNFSDCNQWVPRNMVLGTLEEITLAEEGTDSEKEVVALAALGAPKWSLEVFGKYVSKEIGVDSHDKIVGVLQDFEDCFAGENDRLGVCNVAEHAIETGDCRPIRQSPYSSAWKERELMQTLVQEMEDAGVKLKKCLFAQTRLQALGHVMDKDGIAPDPEKICAVREFPRPPANATNAQKIKHVRSFIGLCSYYRRFISNFAKIAKPLHDLTKQGKSFCWGAEQKGSFNALKERLIEATQLAYPDYGKPFDIHPDACEYGIGAALVQKTGDGERPVAFASRLLSATERNYSITEKECLALVWAMKKFHCYIWGMTVRVVSDHHALCWLTTKKDLAGRLARWALLVQGYEPQVLYKSGKLHEDADALSRYPVGPAEEEDESDSLLPVLLVTLNGDLERIRVGQESVPQ